MRTNQVQTTGDEGDKQQHINGIIKTLWLRPNIQYLPFDLPVTFRRSDIGRFHQEQHYVSSKLNGERHYLLCCKYKEQLFIVFVKRNGSYTFTNVAQTSWPALFNGTLLDVEIIHSNVIAFDCIAYNGMSLVDVPFIHRLQHLQSTVQELQQHTSVTVKQWVILSSPVDLNRLMHSTKNSDGLVFVPCCGTLIKKPFSFKWKPLHTVDLGVSSDRQLWTHSKNVPVATSTIHFTTCVNLPKTFTGIAEFSLSFRDGEWVPSFIQPRYDKLMPNEIDVVHQTLINIQENVNLNELQYVLCD